MNKYQKFSKSQDIESIFIPENTLDYHDLGPLMEHEIRGLYERFIEESIINEYRSVLVITGKGIHSEKPAVIKPLVIKYLRQDKRVASFKQASTHLGGEGALEVHLKNVKT